MEEKNYGGITAPSEAVEQFGYKQELKRALGLRELIVYGLLFIIITAPFAVFGEVHLLSHGMTPMVYLVGMVAMIFTALSYMQMSNRFPIAGSVYSYVQRGINPHIGFFTGWLIMVDYFLLPALNYGFVGAWCSELLPDIPPWAFIAVLIAINTFINYKGISLMAIIDWVIFIVEIIIVVVFVVLGFKYVAGGGGFGELSTLPFYNSGYFDIGFIATAASVACLSFLGFDAISTLSEESIKPEKNIGRATLLTLVIVGGLFILITYVAALVWGSQPLEELDPVSGIFQVAALMGGDALRIILTIVMLVGGMMGSLTAQAAITRILFSMSRDGMMPKFMNKIHPKHKTPYIAVFIVAALVFAVSFVSPIQLIPFVNFGALSSFIVMNFAVFWFFFIRNKKRRSLRDLMLYLVCPFVGMFILGFVWSGFDKLTLIMGFSWLAIGIIVGAVKTKGFKEQPNLFNNIEL